MKSTLSLLLLTILFYTNAFAQENKTTERKKMQDYANKVDNELESIDGDYTGYTDKMQKEYDDYVIDMQKKYNDYVNQINTEFEGYLKNDFKDFQQLNGIKPKNKEPKPTSQPKLSLKERIKQKVVSAYIERHNIPVSSISPIFQKPENVSNLEIPLNIDFFGSTAKLKVDNRSKSLNINTASPEDFAKYWQDFTATHFQIYTESLTKYAEEKNINDWGVYKLIENSADALFTDNNNKNMWMWAMLNQSGYYVKIGYYKNETYLLLPFLQDVYEKPYYNINGNKYYIINDAPNDKKLFTYAESFGGATKSIDLNLIKSLNFRDETNTVVKTTQLPNQDNPISLKLNQTTISFLASYPQTEKSVYLNSVISSNIKDDLYEALAEEIKGKNETEAVAYLLNYLHNSFDYKTDIEQFGNERMFFPDEIFYYPYSDCEDRAVLFADLVNSLVGLDVVATTYPNHMATAVAFTEQVEGVYYVVDGRNFTVCDPTYLNAPIGAVMPQFENVSPRITRINTEYNFMWQEIANKIEKGNKGKIFIKDKAISENGNYIISGWFNDDITVNGQEYSATNKTRDLWFATFNTKGNMEWFLPVKSTGFSFSQAFNVSANGSVYTLINYTGAIGIDRSTVFKKENGYLILGINNNGTTFLSEDLGIESKGVGKFAFYGKYSQTGEKINLVSFPTDEIAFDTEITIDSNNDIMVKGITGEVEGLTKKITALSSETSFSAEKQINSYMNKYIELKFDPKMAGVFASIKLLSQNGSSISGDDIKSLLDNNTPNFKNNNPSLYKSLSRMKFVINKGGIVKIQTQNGKDVSLDAMNIENSSNMQIIKVSENTYKLKFLNGVEVGKSFIWFDLNSVTLHNDGTIIFDYAKGHTKKEVSISSIID